MHATSLLALLPEVVWAPSGETAVDGMSPGILMGCAMESKRFSHMVELLRLPVCWFVAETRRLRQ